MKDVIDPNRVLVLAPHTDDGELGAGGTIARFIDENKEVYYAAFSIARDSVLPHLPSDILRSEVISATKTLGISQENVVIYDLPVRKLSYVRQEILEHLIRLRDQIDPDLILIPSLHDIHQDHSTIANEGIRAFKNRNIWGYELIWNNFSFNPQCFVTLQKHHLQSKVSALNAYTSQSHREYMNEEFIYSMARVRGVQTGVPYAEAFEIVRMVV